MSSTHKVTFEGGMADGRVRKIIEPLPTVLVFQGLWRGRFQIHDYARVGQSFVYRLVA